MENASKTLIIIGGVIISILIINLIVFNFNKRSTLKKEENNEKYIMQVVEWNKKLEAFNRNNLYGTDIMSIANLMQDYNIKNNTEYKEMEMTVIISNEIKNAKVLKKGSYNLSSIIQCTKSLTNEQSEELYNFKVKKFRCTKVEYDGERIYKMQFED